MSIGPDISTLLAGAGGAPPATITLPAEQNGGDGGQAGVLDEIRAALDAVMRAHSQDRDEEDKAKYLQIAKLLQDCLAKNQADMGQALGGDGMLARLARKAG